MAGMKTYAMLGVLFLVAAITIPIGMQQIVGTSTTSAGGHAWNPAVVTMWQVLLPVLVLIGIAIMFVPKFGGKK